MTHTVEIERSKLLSYIKINCTDAHLVELIDKYYYSLDELRVFVRIIDDIKSQLKLKYSKRGPLYTSA